MAKHIPSPNTPVVDENRTASNSWWDFFAGLVGSPDPIASVTLMASPYAYKAPARGCVVVRGGTVAAVTLSRGRATVTMPAAPATYPVSAGDVLTITYSSAPTVTFIPS